jgi:hypothetical protein
MPRAQNVCAYVNAGFLFRLNVNNGGNVLEKPSIVYGGINPQFVSIIIIVIIIIIIIIMVCLLYSSDSIMTLIF